MMDNNHERTKELLANIDRESDAIKTTVYESRAELQETLVKIPWNGRDISDRNNERKKEGIIKEEIPLIIIIIELAG
ncbi:MAG: hypothetical protein A4E26_00003 [Methanobacterium sp. PtaU1.Bin097]|nr:MAG: hypothetical protein A4E26_00003 [Methanobacterium sp. PtaU1.Bin097]